MAYPVCSPMNYPWTVTVSWVVPWRVPVGRSMVLTIVYTMDKGYGVVHVPPKKMKCRSLRSWLLQNMLPFCYNLYSLDTTLSVCITRWARCSIRVPLCVWCPFALRPPFSLMPLRMCIPFDRETEVQCMYRMVRSSDRRISYKAKEPYGLQIVK